jgi:hypothetical protein
MLLGVLIDLSRCFGVFLGKLEEKKGIIGLLKNMCEFVLVPHHMWDWLTCALNHWSLF